MDRRCRLFIGDETATSHYDRAEPWYRLEECREAHLDCDSSAPCYQWGAEPEFDKAWGAFERYVEWTGLDQPSERAVDYESVTFERLAYKRELTAVT